MWKVGLGYVGRNDSWGNGYSLLVLVHAVLPTDNWTLRRFGGQVDTGVDMRHATLSSVPAAVSVRLEPTDR